jgi:hypothetical protein
MKQAARSVEKVYLQFAAGPGDGGRWLEVCIANADGSLSDAGPYPLLEVSESDDSRLWVELPTSSGPVRVLLSELERAIEVARQGVASERRINETR